MAERVLTVKIVGNSSSLERSFKRSSAGAAQFDRSLSRATRGALAGSGVFRSLGRSIAFASGGFLAFASAGQFLRTSIDAAKEAAVTQAQLAAQFKASGLVLGDYQKEIDKTANRLSALSGFQNDELKAAFTTVFRTTGDVKKSLRDLATVADLARAKHIGLAQAALIVAKTEAGNTTLLRRQGIQVAKNATAEQALAKLRRVVAGQGRAGTTEQERFGAVLHNTEEIIGTGILPVLNKYLAEGATWLTQMNESGRLQKDVNATVKTAGDVFAGLKEVVTPLVAVFRSLGGAVGGTKKEVELLAGAFVILKARAKLTGLGLIGGEIAGIGSKSILASGEVATLTSRLALLAKIGAAGIVLNFIPKAKASSNPNAPSRNPVAQFFAGLPLFGPAFSQANRAADAIDKKLGLLPAAPSTQRKGLNPATRGLGPSTHGNPFGELRFGDPTTASRRLLTQTFAQAKALNPQLTRKAFDLGQEVARAFINGATTSPKGGKKPLGGLSLAGRFNIAELKLARAELTKTTADDRLQLQIEASITREQIAGTKKLKEKTQLTQKLVGIMGQLKGLTKAVSDSFTLPERFSVDAAKAATTATQKDDLAAARETKVFVSKMISSGKLRGQALEQAYGDLASANDQLLAAQKEAAAKTLARISGKQFRALGLDASGAALTPNTKSLRKDLGKFSDAVSGTFLDTSKTQSVLSKIRRVLGGGLGALSKDVRSTIKGMLDDLDQQLKDHSGGGPETKFKKANTAKLLAGLGLDPAEVRAVRARLSQLGPGGTVPRSSPASPAFAGAGTQAPFTANLILDGRVAATVVSRHQDKQRRRNPGQRRGPHAGQ